MLQFTSVDHADWKYSVMCDYIWIDLHLVDLEKNELRDNRKINQEFLENRVAMEPEEVFLNNRSNWNSTHWECIVRKSLVFTLRSSLLTQPFKVKEHWLFTVQSTWLFTTLLETESVFQNHLFTLQKFFHILRIIIITIYHWQINQNWNSWMINE